MAPSQQSNRKPSESSVADPHSIGRRPILLGIASAGLLAVALVIATRMIDGADQAGRAAVELVVPMGLVWLTLFGVAVTFAVAGQKKIALFFLLLWIFVSVTFNGSVADRLITTVEYPMGDEIPSQDLPLRAVVTLGGAAGTNVYGIDEVTRDGERIVSAAQMWHAGQTRMIVCTGMALDPRRDQPAKIARRLLMSLGVPEDAIVVIGGEDTQSELEAVSELLKDPPPGMKSAGSIGLITSAFHIPRAMRMAQQVSVDVIPIPVASYADNDRPFSPADLIPTADAGHEFRTATKEILARVLGK